MTARWARTARGWSVSLLTGVLSAALHASAGGGFPAPVVVLLTALIAGLLSTLLIGRAPSLPRLAGTVAVGQMTFHTAFTTLGGSAAVSLTHGAHSAHTGHGGLVTHVAAHTGTDHGGLGMLFAHIVAGALSAVLMAHGERALSALNGLARFTLRRLTPAPEVPPLLRVRSARPGSQPLLPRTVIRLRSVRFRGPPSPLAA